MSDGLNILKTRKLISNWPNSQQKEGSWYWLSIDDFIARTCATKISKELTELVIEKLITQNVIFKKNVQGLDLVYKLNEKEVSISTANSFIGISEIQPNTSNN